MKSRKILLHLTFAFLLSYAILVRWPSSVTATPSTAIVRIISEVDELGPENVTNKEFKVAVVVENVENLYGLSVKVYINTTYFQYVSHTTTIPWNDTQTPIPPSPYGGILYTPVTLTKDEYDPSANLLIIAYSSRAPAKPFFGNGTVCILRLKVIYHPVGEGFFNVTAAGFSEIKLAGYGVPPPPIPFTSQDLTMKMNYLDNVPPSISNPYQDPPGTIMQPDQVVEVDVGQDVTVRVNVTDASPIKNVVLFYNITSNTWANITMQRISDNLYEATIPSQFNIGDKVFYYIEATDIAGNTMRSPDIGLYYRYQVIPELNNITLALTLLTSATLAMLLNKKEK
ncbi:MAG: hypothetical protein QXR45_07435 [Candidatus Bathyarchaeia archaeon]